MIRRLYLALIFRPRLSADRRARLVAAAKAGAPVSEQLARLVAYTVPDRNPDGDLIAIITIVDPKEASALELAGVCQGVGGGFGRC